MTLFLRTSFALLAMAAVGLTLAGWAIGELMKLQPCPLCIFQRLLYLLIGLLALADVLFPGARRLWGALLAVTAAGGVATAAYQTSQHRSVCITLQHRFGDHANVKDPLG